MTSTGLKWIAVFSMVVDHGTLAFLPQTSVLYVIGRIIGRLAFPIYAFLIVEGYAHTRDWKRYLRDLLILAVVSELPFDLFVGESLWYPRAQNVVWTLALGLIGIAFGEQLRMSGWDNLRWMPYAGVCLAAWFLQADYGLEGTALILAFWLWRGSNHWWIWPGVLMAAMGGIGIFALGSLPIIGAYHGEKGAGVPKYLFYGIYPVHLLLFGVLVWLR